VTNIAARRIIATVVLIAARELLTVLATVSGTGAGVADVHHHNRGWYHQ